MRRKECHSDCGNFKKKNKMKNEINTNHTKNTENITLKQGILFAFNSGFITDRIWT